MHFTVKETKVQTVMTNITKLEEKSPGFDSNKFSSVLVY